MESFWSTLPANLSRAEKSKRNAREWRKTHPETRVKNTPIDRARQAEYRNAKREELKIRNRAQYLKRKAENKLRSPTEADRRKGKLWRQRRRDHLRAYGKAYRAERYSNDPYYRFVMRLRNRLRSALQYYNATKVDNTAGLTGCDMATLRAHIESRFKPGMTWANWGRGEGTWNLDHERPCASFDLRDPEQQRACFHYSNLQPLWAFDNLSKADKILTADA